MRREPSWTAPGKVVHVVGRVTDEVCSFLGPATHALARAGRDQAVVMIDEPRYRHHVSRLHEAAELLLTPSVRDPIGQWRAMRDACRAALSEGPMEAVHLHGLFAGLVGAQAVRACSMTVPIYFSPHGSRSVNGLRGLGAMLLPLIARFLGPLHAAIVNVPNEAQALQRWRSTELVESPVGSAFFAAPRNEARRPLLVTGGRSQGPRNVELLAQLAVLLSGGDLRIGFNWIGSVDAVSQARLTAANVAVFDVSSDAECAARLAAGWVYVAPGGTRGFALFLAEAMAAGMACVALDCVQHRHVIRDGENGFLCRSEQEMIARIASLIDSRELRARIGAAARSEAGRRFGEPDFCAKLLAAYALPA